MDTGFQTDMFYGCLIKGRLHGAMAYLRQFPEQAQRPGRYQAVFEQDHRPALCQDAALAGLCGCPAGALCGLDAARVSEFAKELLQRSSEALRAAYG